MCVRIVTAKPYNGHAIINLAENYLIFFFA